ncbi:SpoIIIAH-like family protein [Anaerocolumna sp. AGMB13020]|uniref:SpoIIIAH-like family protein n=1 Tax=Anaerocolumna sp. AGMB13020 TaxID=3081750 RepID=UPI0029530D6E|nr:SpoIIIAH-like family protein [Anaerocolumna sp. AGMB13020]WOO36188.1 SpoIIIAH-like family protein [Anaerocolumna sp. AGMB13020]
MKNLFRKNNIIIAALAIMIIIAGYLNFSSNNDDSFNLSDTNDYDSTEATMGDDISDSDFLSLDDQGNLLSDSALDLSDEDTQTADDATVDEAKAEDTAKADDATAEDSKETADSKENAKASDTAKADSNTEETADAKGDKEETSTPGEAVLVSTITSSDFFSATKIKRENTRSENYETCMDIIKAENLSEENKQVAVNELMEIERIRDIETASEIMLEAKGFSDTLVYMQDKRVDVVVNAEKITEQDLAQIMDVVKSQTKMKASQIFVNPAIANE